MGFAAALELFEEQHHDVKEADALVAHRGVLVHQAAAHQAFERAQQAPLGAIQVGLHGFCAIQHAVRFAGKEQRGRHFGLGTIQRNDLQGAVLVNQCTGGVGGAEVNAQHQGSSSTHYAGNTCLRKAAMSATSRGCTLCGMG